MHGQKALRSPPGSSLNGRTGITMRAATSSRCMASMGMGSARQRPMRVSASAERARNCILKFGIVESGLIDVGRAG